MKTYITHSENETRALGRKLAEGFSKGSVIALCGDLGCGKTAFVRGVADYFDCGDVVTSPTFTLVNQYDGRETVYHFDVYRLEHPPVEECDWMDDYLFGDGICLIEWAENIDEVLPDTTVRIKFEKNPNDENERIITI